MGITFINNPEFKVDFNKYNPEAPQQEPTKLGTKEKILRTANTLFLFIKYPVEATCKSAYLTISYSGTSFKHIVLGYYGSLSNFRFSNDIYLVAFKIGFWALSVTWCFVTTTLRLIGEKAFPTHNSDMLHYFAGAGIKVSHIKCDELVIDTSGVPNDVKVSDLLEMYDKINFADPEKPGYMAEKSRQEGSKINSVEDLKKDLTTFVDRVNGRVAFLATPPSYDTPRLMAFYQQIENAVRVSIHTVNKKVTDFEAKNGTDVEKYSQIQLNEYKNLLEDRARLVIDLAIGGSHCGARYMGEAMTTYYNICGDALQADKNLEDTLTAILAQARKGIADRHIQTHLSNDTHSFTKYMSILGKILAIPGSKNIDESFSENFDRDKFLKLFFADYTEDYIFDKIKEKIKTSQNLREKIFDWLKDQIEDWNVEGFTSEEKVNEKVTALQSIMDATIEQQSPQMEALGILKELMTHLKAEGIELPVKQGEDNFDDDENIPEGANADFTRKWDSFLDELWVLDEAKTWLDDTKRSENEIANKIRTLTAQCKIDGLTEDKIEKLMTSIMNNEQIDVSQFPFGNRSSWTDLQNLLTSLKNNSVALPINSTEDLKQNWNIFLANLFALDEGKNWLKNSKRSVAELRERKQTIINNCKKDVIGSDKVELYKVAIINNEEIDLSQANSNDAKIAKMRVVLPINEDTYKRILNNETSLKEAVKNHLDLERKTEFLNRLNLDEIKEKGLSTGLMEWLLVSHNVFNVQALKVAKNEEIKELKTISDETSKTEFRSVVVENFLYSKENTNQGATNKITDWLVVDVPQQTIQESEEGAKQITANYEIARSGTNTKRYGFEQLSSRDTLLKYLLGNAYRHDAEAVIYRANRLDPTIQPITARVRKVFAIHLPKGLGVVLHNPVFKIAATIASVYFTWKYSLAAYTYTTDLMQKKIIPFAINNLPEQFFQGVNKVIDVKEYIWNNWLSVLFYTWLTREVIIRLPNIPYITATARTINIASLFWMIMGAPETIYYFAYYKARDAAVFTWTQCNQMGSFMHSVADDNAKERLARCEEKINTLWGNVNMPQAVPTQ